MKAASIQSMSTNDHRMMAAAILFIVQHFRASHKYGWCLEEPTMEVLMDSDLVLINPEDNNSDNMAVCAVHKGELKFLCGKGPAVDQAVSTAKMLGAEGLNCYGTHKLVELYGKHGFKVQSTEPFDETRGANVPRWAGEPEVLVMAA